MLKQALLGVLFLPALVVAQQQGPVTVEKPVICGPATVVIGAVMEFKELPIWGSQLTDSQIALFANAKTETWTMIQWNKNVACVIDSGKGYFLNNPKIAIDPKKFN